MAWEVFERPRRGTGDPFPTVTLGKQAQLSLNRCSAEALGFPEYVTLLWDKKLRVIGVRPTTADAPSALRCAGRQEPKKSCLIAAKGFCGWAGIGEEEHGRWRATVEDGVLAINLCAERLR